jgi:hypothetical protein
MCCQHRQLSVEDLRSEVDRDHNVIYGSRVGEEGVEGFGTRSVKESLRDILN